MNESLANELFTGGRSHAMASHLLYEAAFAEGEEREDVDDPAHFVFNGPYSLSIVYLASLGLELMLKAAVVAWGGASHQRELREIGHDLRHALQAAREAGFNTEAPHLDELIELLRQPYLEHWLRYERPAEFPLPWDFTQVVETLNVVDQTLQARLWNGDQPD